jgi:hypothetical protein
MAIHVLFRGLSGTFSLGDALTFPRAGVGRVIVIREPSGEATIECQVLPIRVSPP